MGIIIHVFIDQPGAGCQCQAGECNGEPHEVVLNEHTRQPGSDKTANGQYRCQHTEDLALHLRGVDFPGQDIGDGTHGTLGHGEQDPHDDEYPEIRDKGHDQSGDQGNRTGVKRDFPVAESVNEATADGCHDGHADGGNQCDKGKVRSAAHGVQHWLLDRGQRQAIGGNRKHDKVAANHDSASL